MSMRRRGHGPRIFGASESHCETVVGEQAKPGPLARQHRATLASDARRSEEITPNAPRATAPRLKARRNGVVRMKPRQQELSEPPVSI